MDVIRQANYEILNYLGGPQLKNKNRKYRLNKYLIEDSVEGGKVVCNMITGAVVMIKPYEWDNIYTNDPCDYANFLFENYFIVPEDFDEDNLIEEYRKSAKLYIGCTYLDRLDAYTILTTTECNARCPYCYQHVNKHKLSMSEETARKVVSYIINTSYSNSVLQIGWFGGEPLYNSKVMDIISSGIMASGRRFTASMISNGYLLNDEIINKCKNQWNINNIQITLDGTEKEYNRIKAYVYKDDPNPYKTVIENIHKALDAKIGISIRLNCSLKNIENIKELVLELSTEFTDRKLLSVYTHHIFEDSRYKLTPEQRDELFHKMQEIDAIIAENNLAVSNHMLGGGIRPRHCMVDSGKSVTIQPDGNIGLCEHYNDRDFISNIDNPLNKDFDMIRSWRNYVPYAEICDGCPIKPVCTKVHKCPDEARCEESQKQYQIYKLKSGIKRFYTDWLENLNNNICDGNCRKQSNDNQLI